MLDICLIIAGLAAVAASFFAFEKFDGKKKASDDRKERSVSVWSEKDEKRVRERAEALLSETIEEAMEKADESLSHLSNEKIMAVTELSDQVIDQIKKNHTEVVFLYDMLNEKDSEIKQLINEIDKSKADAEDVAKNAVSKLRKILKVIQQQQEKFMEEKRRAAIQQQKTAMDLLEENKKIKDSQAQTEAADAVKTEEKTAEEINIKENPPADTEKEPLPDQGFEKEQKSQPSQEPVLKTEPVFINEESVPKSFNNTGENQNSEILKLYDEGKSIVEIAKMLRLGQGEVKLVIDLFQGARG